MLEKAQSDERIQEITATKREIVKGNTIAPSESGAETGVALPCAQCGEIAGLAWLLANTNQQEAEEKIRFLLGYGCHDCCSQDWADLTAYADGHLLRLVELFLFTHLHSTKARVALLLAVGDGIHRLQREILSLPETWRNL